MMSSMGIEMETTEPEEVASFCLAQIKDGKYWINPSMKKANKLSRIVLNQLSLAVICLILIFFN